jgi:hypothetical protein
MMFVREMEFFMETSEKEQRLRLSGTIPSLDEFWHYRLGSSAVAVCLSLNEFSWEGMDLPIEFYADKDVRALFRYTNTIISAVNDLLSIKKEIVSSPISPSHAHTCRIHAAASLISKRSGTLLIA